MSLLQVRDLAKAFGGVQAVREVSFSLAAGELLALIGPNGAGKTTCFNMLNGQLTPDRGTIELAGTSIAGKAPREICRLGVARTFQITAAFGSLSVRENVQMALLAHEGRTFDFIHDAGNFSIEGANALLSRVGMLEQAERTCAELAYGDLKRVELAIALASEPRLLLMDEPTAGMAPEERGELMQLVAGIARNERLAVLFTEHDMEVVFRFADRVLVLAEGALIAGGSPDEVRADPRVQAAYLGVEPAHA
jgi:branched-chain amino acid transport system ATP-binding protein